MHSMSTWELRDQMAPKTASTRLEPVHCELRPSGAGAAKLLVSHHERLIAKEVMHDPVGFV